MKAGREKKKKRNPLTQKRQQNLHIHPCFRGFGILFFSICLSYHFVMFYHHTQPLSSQTLSLTGCWHLSAALRPSFLHLPAASLTPHNMTGYPSCVLFKNHFQLPHLALQILSILSPRIGYFGVFLWADGMRPDFQRLFLP